MQGKESLGMGVAVRMVRGSSWLSSPVPEGGWQGRVGAEKAGSRERWMLSMQEWLVFLQADNEEPLALCAGKR